MPETPVMTEAGFDAPYNPEGVDKKNFRWRIEKTNKSDDGVRRTVPPIPKDMYKGANENPSNTAFGRVVSNPLVPLGLVATTFCLAGICRSVLVQKDPVKGQVWMRARIIAQGLTVVAMVGGAYFMSIGDEHRRNKRKPLHAPIVQEEASSDIAKEL